MKPDEAVAAVKKKLVELDRFRREDVPDIIGTEAVNHFQGSFRNEGKTDENLQKWPDVKRRDPNSEWYGFTTGNKKGFSPTRAKDKILTGDSSELKNSIHYVKKSDRVTVRSDSPYGAVHQFGLPAKVFGKAAFTMKPRPFIYQSSVLEKAIRDKIIKGINQIKKA